MQAKVVLCGEGFVGKSTIRERYLGISFRSSYLQTIGADYATKNQEYESGKSLRLQIWDLAGQQKFSNIREAFYHLQVKEFPFENVNHSFYQRVP